MNTRNIKKGFTLTELIIVIVIIGILAGVLIPTFINVVNKANKAADLSLIRNLNEALTLDRYDNGEHKNMTQALKAADDYGFAVDKIDAKVSKNKILWDSENDVFCYLVGEDTLEYYPNSVSKEIHLDDPKEVYLLWIIDNKVNSKFSTYLFGYSGTTTESNPLLVDGVGLDTGKCDVAFVKYVNTSETAKNVVIRTNSYLTTLTVNAPSDIVRHYDKAGSVNVISTDNASYHENGTVPFLEVAGGHIVLEAEAKVEALHFTATDGEFENEDGKTISIDLSKVSSENMPSFSRDSVQIATEGTFVAKVTNETDEYIWLWGNGTQTEMVVASTEGAITTESGSLKDGITAGTEDGTIADQIANNAVVNEETGETEYVVKTTKEEAKETYYEAFGEALVDVVDEEGNAKYVARIGATGYEVFTDAVEAANNSSGSTIVLLKDIANSGRQTFTFNADTTIDLNTHTLTLNSYGKIDPKNNITIKNGTYHSASSIAPNNNITITFDKVAFEKDSSASAQSFQLYGKSNITINFNDSTISYSGTPNSNINNLAFIGHTGSDTNVYANIRNTLITWTDNVPFITYANNTLTCYTTFDRVSMESAANLDNIVLSTKTSNPVYLIKQTEDDGIYKYQPIVAEYWLDKVSSQPAGYVVDGDSISIGSAEAFAWFAKQAETNNFAGKAISLTTDIDLGAYIWKPINCNFAGTFNGGNHTISNVYTTGGYQVTSSSTLYGNGIFHRVSGTIENLTINKATIGISDNTNIVGVVAGYCSGNATFRNITVTNSRVQGFGKVAGIVGMQESGTITMSNCSVNNTIVEGFYNCAGFIGLAQGTVSCTGCNSQNVTFYAKYSSTNVYMDVTEENHVGKYWLETSDSSEYYAAWGDLYNDYDQETIDGITYIGKCYNY